MSKPVCTVMVGLPALGKSTHIENMYKEDTWIYSTDMYIEAVAEDNGLTYDQAFESSVDAAKRFNDEKLRDMIRLQKDIIWDQTNLGVKKRIKIIRQMTQAGYDVDCICLMPPWHGVDKFSAKKNTEEWQRRLASREGKTIPNTVISNMMGYFVVPTTEEGFSKITFYDMYGALIGIDYSED